VYANHFRHMALAGGAVAVSLLVLGAQAETALTYALLLACPVMMSTMLWMFRQGAASSEAWTPGNGSSRPEPNGGSVVKST
jgi:hypothetical protein